MIWNDTSISIKQLFHLLPLFTWKQRHFLKEKYQVESNTEKIHTDIKMLYKEIEISRNVSNV